MWRRKRFLITWFRCRKLTTVVKRTLAINQMRWSRTKRSNRTRRATQCYLMGPRRTIRASSKISYQTQSTHPRPAIQYWQIVLTLLLSKRKSTKEKSTTILIIPTVIVTKQSNRRRYVNISTISILYRPK